MNKLIEKIIDFAIWLEKPWIKRTAQRHSDILQAIWDVRWDYYGKQSWEISTFQLLQKMNLDSSGKETYRYNIGLINGTVDFLEAEGLVGSVLKDPTPEREGRCQRMVYMLPKGIALMLEHLEKSK